MPIRITKKNATVFYAAIQVLYFCTLAMVSGYASAYLLNRGFTNGQIGILLGVGNLGAVGAQLLTAAVVSRTGMRIGKVMIGASAVIAALALALLLLPLSGAAFCITYALVFLLTQSMMASVNSLYRGYHEQGTKINFGVARGFGSAAYSITSLATGVLIQKFTPGILPGLYAVPCLLLCVIVCIFNAPNVEERQAANVTPKEKKILLREYPQFYLFFAGVMCLATSNGFTETYLLQIIQRIGGASSNLGVAMFISAMMELPAMVLYRRFADKVGNRRLLAFAGWMWALKNFLIMLAPNVYLIYAAELLQFVGFAIYVPAGVRYIAHTLPESEFLKGQALVGSAFTAGYLISSFVGGPMIDLGGLNATLWGVQLFSVGGVLLFTCAMTKSLSMEYGDDEWVRNIQMQSGRLSKLITNLVTLSRLDEENPFPVRTEFSLSDALWEISEPFVSISQAKGKGYTQDIADGLTVTGDRAAIQQMVSILLENALKYSPDGGSISLTARRSGKKTAITVSNSVDGAQRIDAARLFDRFYRADESHSGTVSGTGIGLSIAKATVQAHGGKISASQSGDTITFQVLL